MIKFFNKRLLAGILATGITLSPNVSGFCATSTQRAGQNIVEYEEPIENVDNYNLSVEGSNDYNLSVVPALEAKVELNVRSKGSTKGEVIGVLQPGEKVPFVKKLDNGWCEIEYNGEKGYVNGKYTKDSSIITAQCLKFVYLKNDENSFYDKPNGSEIDTLPVLEFAKVYGEEDNYYLVEVNGDIGYVSKDDCKKLDDTCVIVDISSQTLIFYKDLEEKLTTSVVTGKDSTPSDIGLFDIYGKTKNRTLKGSDYESFVNYWMPYNGGEGLHDATWRSSFGGDGYHDNGSHGCINMPLSKAEELYSEVEVGNMVLVKK